MKKKVLYISYDGMTDPLGQSQVIPYLQGLSDAGYRITIVSAEKSKRMTQQGSALAKLFIASHIQWVSVKYTNRIPGVSAYHTFQRLLRQSLAWHRKESFDLVHCRSYIPSLIGLRLKRKYGVKFLFDIRGFWADERLEGGIWNPANPLYRWAYGFFKRKEKEFLEESDAIVSLTGNAREEILSRDGFRIAEEKISVIPCCVDMEFFASQSRAVPQQELRKRLGIADGSYVLSYSGSLGTWYLPDEMLRFFRALLKQQAGAIFLWITPDSSDIIFKAAERLGIERHTLRVVSAQRDEMPALLQLSNASVFLIRNSYSKRASSPTKMGEIMSLGIPVVCNAGIGDVDTIMAVGNAGILIEKLDEAHYEQAAYSLLNRKFSKDVIQTVAAGYFSLHHGVASYQRIYDSI